MSVARLAALIALAAACNRAGERAGDSHPRDPELRRLIGRAHDMHDALADGARRAGSDCAAMAQAFSEVLAANPDLVGKAEIEGDAALRARFDQLLAEQVERQMAWVERFGEAVAPCASDPRVGAALAPLEEGDLLRAD